MSDVQGEQICRAYEELKLTDGAYADLTWQLDRALEHIDSDGRLRGEGKWRIDEICQCLVKMRRIDQERRDAAKKIRGEE